MTRRNLVVGMTGNARAGYSGQVEVDRWCPLMGWL